MKKTKGDTESTLSEASLSGEKFSGTLLDVLTRPQIVIALITAIAGPWTIAQTATTLKSARYKARS